MYYLCHSESGRWAAPGPSPAFSLSERDSATTEADFLSLLFDFLSVLPFFRKPEPGRPAPAGRSEERPQERRALRQILNFHKNAQGRGRPHPVHTMSGQRHLPTCKISLPRMRHTPNGVRKNDVIIRPIQPGYDATRRA